MSWMSRATGVPGIDRDTRYGVPGSSRQLFQKDISPLCHEHAISFLINPLKT
jgi:hypothetical protein